MANAKSNAHALMPLTLIAVFTVSLTGCATLDLQSKGLSAVSASEIASVALAFETPNMHSLTDNRLIMQVTLKGSDKPIALPKLYDVKLTSPDGSAGFPGEDRVRSVRFHDHLQTTVVASHPNLPQGEILISAPNRWADSYKLDYSGPNGQSAGDIGGDGANIKIEVAEINAEGFANSSGPIMVLVRVYDQTRGADYYSLFPRNSQIQIITNGGNGKPGARGMDSGMLRTKASSSQPEYYEGSPGSDGGHGGNGGFIEFNYGHRGLDRMFKFVTQGGQGGIGGSGGVGARKYRDSSGGFYYNVGPNAPSGQSGNRGQPGQVRTLLQSPMQLFAGIETSPWTEFLQRIRVDQ